MPRPGTRRSPLISPLPSPSALRDHCVSHTSSPYDDNAGNAIVSFLSVLAISLIRFLNAATRALRHRGREIRAEREQTMILVTGATGLNGKELVRRLSARGVALRALVRSAAKAAELSALPHVEIVAGDMAHPETLLEALRGVDRAMLISSSDPQMLEVQANFIAAAAQAGRSHVVKLRDHAGARLALPVRPDAWRDREAARGLGHGIHASARRRVHADLLSAGAVDRRQGRAVPAHGGRQDRLDRRRRHRRGRRHGPDDVRA